MLELLGSGYVIEHCMSAFSERKETDRYREYVSECLRLILENTAKLAQGRYVSKKYSEFVKNESIKETESDSYTPGKITERIKSKFR